MRVVLTDFFADHLHNNLVCRRFCRSLKRHIGWQLCGGSVPFRRTALVAGKAAIGAGLLPSGGLSDQAEPVGR